MSDTPENQFLFEFGIDEKRARAMTCRVTRIVVKNLKIAKVPGCNVLRCDLDKSACVRDIVRYIDSEGLSTIDAQWMFYAFGSTIGNDNRLCEIAREVYVSRRLFAPLKTTTTPEE